MDVGVRRVVGQTHAPEGLSRSRATAGAAWQRSCIAWISQTGPPKLAATFRCSTSAHAGELKARVRELQQEIDEADAAHDVGRAERAREELDQLVEHLSGALGLGGAARHLGSAAERA